MDSIIPGQVLSEIERIRRAGNRSKSRHLVVAGPRRHRVMELTANGFVIEADGLPRLRGFVDILKDDERIARRLAQFAWAEDGLVGYEFKHDAGRRETPPDYVEPEHKGLIGPPDAPDSPDAEAP